jgi:cob(I)alamin adenosyltransferase
MATKIYTKTGDDGTTALFGGTRVLKHGIRIESYGTVDELNAVLGMVLTHEMSEQLRGELTQLSSDLFTLGADLATPLDPPPTYHIPRIVEEHVAGLERKIDAHDATLPELKAFILPGGTQAAAGLHLARTVCRRAERRCVLLAENEDVGEYVVRYLNRLSDYLFMAARVANHTAGVVDVPWRSSTL